MQEALLLSIPEAAALLRLSRSKTYGLVAAGVLPVVRIDRSVRVPRAALARWVEAQTASPLAEPAVPNAATRG